MTYPPDGCRRR